MDLTFDMNYVLIVEHLFAEPKKRIIGRDSAPRCRFCEQSAPRVSFSAVRPVISESIGNTSLFTREVCDECAQQFGATIDQDFARLWTSLESLRSDRPIRDYHVPSAISVGAFKSLIRMAISLVPESELASFSDTIEWVGNPDHDFDIGLFEKMGCLLYQVHVPYATGWTSLARRHDDQAPFPYMLFFLGSERLIIQAHLPLCTHDEDLDGTEIRIPERSFSTGVGSDLRASMCLALPIRPSDQPQPRRIRLFA
jgi:hypothetical protein